MNSLITGTITGHTAQKPLARGTFRFLAQSIFVFALMVPQPVLAANFSITPTTLELSGGVKSGVFSIINTGEEKLNCQIEVKEWGQDAEGKDVYTEARDVVVFPKIMTVDRNEQRAIRIGVKGPQSSRERTYRLFAEEIPGQKKEQEVKTTGKITAGLTIAFRYAVPIFVKPVRPQESAIIERIDISKSAARAVVQNTGNIHVKVLSVMFKGKAIDGRELFSQEVSGWYVLQGQSRTYEATVPNGVCKELAAIDVSVQGENAVINGTTNVQNTMCAQ